MTVNAPHEPSVVLIWESFEPQQRHTLANLVHRVQRETDAFFGEIALRSARPGGVSVELHMKRAPNLPAFSRIATLATTVGALAIDVGRLRGRDRDLFLCAYDRRHGPAVPVGQEPFLAVERLLDGGPLRRVAEGRR